MNNLRKVSTSEFNKSSETANPELLIRGAELIEKDIKKAEAEQSDLNVADKVNVMANGVLIAHIIETTTASGVIIPQASLEAHAQSMAEKPQLVLAVGPMVKEIKPGDMAILRLNARPDTVTYEDRKYMYFREHDILLTLKK